MLGLGSVAPKDLPQPDRCSILQVRPPGLDDGVERLHLLLQGAVQRPQRRDQLVAQGQRGGDVDRRRDHVVARLAHIDVVIRMHAQTNLRTVFVPLTEQLDRTAGDDLVGVHVSGSPRAGLEDINGKLAVPRTIDHLIAGLHDRVGPPLVQQLLVTIGEGAGPLHVAQSVDEPSPEAQLRNVEILYGALRLRPP